MISPRGATRSEQDAIAAAEERGFKAGIEFGIRLIVEMHERDGRTDAAQAVRTARIEERKDRE